MSHLTLFTAYALYISLKASRKIVAPLDDIFSRWKAWKRRSSDKGTYKKRKIPRESKASQTRLRVCIRIYIVTLALYFAFSLDSSRRMSTLTSIISILNYSELLGYGFRVHYQTVLSQLHIYFTYPVSTWSAITCGYLIDKQASDTLVILIKFAIVCKLPFSILTNKSN